MGVEGPLDPLHEFDLRGLEGQGQVWFLDEPDSVLPGDDPSPFPPVTVEVGPHGIDLVPPFALGHRDDLAALVPGFHDVGVDVAVGGVTEGRKPDVVFFRDLLDPADMSGDPGPGTEMSRISIGLRLDGLVDLGPDGQDVVLFRGRVRDEDVDRAHLQADLGDRLGQPVLLLLGRRVQDDEEMCLPLVAGPGFAEELLGDGDDIQPHELDCDRDDVLPEKPGDGFDGRLKLGERDDQRPKDRGWAMSWMTALVMTPSVPSEPMKRFIKL